MEYKITDIVEVTIGNEHGIEINIGSDGTDVCSIRIKTNQEHSDILTPGLQTLIKRHLNKINELKTKN